MPRAGGLGCKRLTASKGVRLGNTGAKVWTGLRGRRLRGEGRGRGWDQEMETGFYSGTLDACADTDGGWLDRSGLAKRLVGSRKAVCETSHRA